MITRKPTALELYELYSTGLSTTDLGRMFGVHASNISITLNEAGYSLRDHLDAAKLAYERRNGKRDNEIVEARLKGQSLQSIGNTFGLTRERIRQICAKYIEGKAKRC